MESKIIEEKQNPLFARKEIVLEIENEAVPSYSEVEKVVAEKFSTQADTIKIKKIDAKFGSNIFTIYVNVYDTKEDKENTETKTKKEREAEKKALEERLKAEKEAKAAAKAEEEVKKAEAEKSVEEVKEEVTK